MQIQILGNYILCSRLLLFSLNLFDQKTYVSVYSFSFLIISSHRLYKVGKVKEKEAYHVLQKTVRHKEAHLKIIFQSVCLDSLKQSVLTIFL